MKLTQPSPATRDELIAGIERLLEEAANLEKANQWLREQYKEKHETK
jgi:hypothetical protein